MPSPSINLTKARSLCTVAEYRVVRASLAPRLSETELRRKISLVRGMQDKWRDQSIRQRRSAQETFGKRAVDASGRSKEKKKLFTDLVAILEKRLGAGAAESGSKKTKRSTKKKAKATKTVELKSTKTPAARVGKRSTGGAKAPPTPKSASKPAERRKASTLGLASSVKSGLEPAFDLGGVSSMASLAAISAPAHRAVRPSAKSQLAAETMAKNSRFREGGERRTMSHVKASGKRAQARRDSRG